MSAHNPYWYRDTLLRGYVCRLLWFWKVYLYLFGVRVKWQYLILSLILSHPVLSITDLIRVRLHLSLILCDVPPTGITVMSHPRGSPRHRHEIELHIMCRSIFWFTIPPRVKVGHHLPPLSRCMGHHEGCISQPRGHPFAISAWPAEHHGHFKIYPRTARGGDGKPKNWTTQYAFDQFFSVLKGF